MSYIKRLLEDTCEAIHKRKAKVGDRIIVTIDTYQGKKKIKHTVTQSDLDWTEMIFNTTTLSPRKTTSP